MFTTLVPAISWLEEKANLPSPSKENKHEQVLRLLTLCGNPHKELPAIHLAGSKGKSSTAQALAALLQETGMNVGLFLSPHIVHYNERIKINLSPLNDAAFLSSINCLHRHINEERSTNPSFMPSTFEKLFAIACMQFRDCKCDVAVIEAGIGGRHDTTNVLVPILSIITAIEREHCAILGNTIAEIARDKAGIIKGKIPVLVGLQKHHGAETILRARAKMLSAPYFLFAELARLNLLSHGTEGIKMKLELPHLFASGRDLRNNFQSVKLNTRATLPCIAENHALAYTAYCILQQKNSFPPLTHSPQFSFNAQLPCRAELWTGSVPVYSDIAHSPQSLSATLNHVTLEFSRTVLLIGISEDKDEDAIAEAIQEPLLLFQKIFITQAGSFKPKNPELLYWAIRKNFSQTDLIQCISNVDTAFCQAIDYAKRNHCVLVLTGSTYLCSECREKYYRREEGACVT